VNASIASQVRLHCQPPKAHPPASVTWFKDGQPITARLIESSAVLTRLASNTRSTPHNSSTSDISGASSSAQSNTRHRRQPEVTAVRPPPPTLSTLTLVKGHSNVKPESSHLTEPNPDDRIDAMRKKASQSRLIAIDSERFGAFPSTNSSTLNNLSINSTTTIEADEEDDEPINLDNYLLLADNSLLIQELHFDDQGNFECRASNIAGEQQSNEAFVRIKG
jgi:hypothetical protein